MVYVIQFIGKELVVAYAAVVALPPSVSCHTMPSKVTAVPGSRGPRQSGSVIVPISVPTLASTYKRKKKNVISKTANDCMHAQCGEIVRMVTHVF